MSNLSDLLPAGAAAKQLTFTDSGSGISSKAPVVLNSDGTVTAVTGATGSVGSSTQMNSIYYIANSNGRNAVYDTSNDKVVVFYTDYNGTPTRLPYAVVGTVSSGSISFGTPVVVASGIGVWDFGVAFDSTANKVIITYRDATNTEFRSQVGTVSGTSISFGSAQQIGSINYSSEVDCIYDATADRVVTMVTNSGNGAVFVGQVSGTSITWGSAQTLSGADGRPRLVYDPDEGKTICVYRTASSDYYLTGAVATISSSTATFGTPVTGISSAMGDYLAVAYDTGSNKIVAGGTLSSGGHTVALVGSVSGTSITWGSYDFAHIGTSYYTSISYDVTANKTIITFTDSSFHAKYNVATVSGTTISLSGAVALVSVSNTFYGYTLYDPDTQQNILTYGDSTNSNYGESLVYTITYNNLTAQAFVGVADSAISASAAGSVIVQGGTVTGVSSGTGVSAGTAVQYSASNLADVYAADSVYDSTNNKIVVVYDGAGSGAGYGIVGTISGTSVSYGSAVQFSGGNARMSQVTYDSTNQRVVVAYSDAANSGYLTAAVGTVSGTSISWGTPVVADSTVNDFYIGIDFDINAGKVLIIWKDNSTAYNYGIVGTVSGTSISFGTKATVDTSYGYQMIGGLTYDANAQKHLFFRPRTSGTVADGYVGTISGTSVSWGSATSATTTQSLSVGWGSYDSNAQKVVVTYRIGAGGMGSQVATISGTSVSFGTQVVVDASINPDFTTNYYDSTDQTIVAFGRATNYYGYVGTVSGTSISWSSASTLLLDAAFGYGLGTPAYDANADKGLILFANAGDSAAESAVTTAGALPLTTGTKYYVTTSGGFSSSADTPSVNAGLAISTTSLLLNGDS